tara:strand:- start:5165 stop:5536 length:372 start_codon:yes stop_codon:yes gene_type:complete
MKALFTSILTKKDGEWKHALSVKENEYNDLMDELPEGTKVNITIEVQGKDATYSQKKRIHAMIRQISNDTGMDFDSLKLEVKERAGLSIDGKYKSFADCDTDELNGAIQSCIAIGDFVGCNVR